MIYTNSVQNIFSNLHKLVVSWLTNIPGCLHKFHVNNTLLTPNITLVHKYVGRGHSKVHINSLSMRVYIAVVHSQSTHSPNSKLMTQELYLYCIEYLPTTIFKS